MNMIFQTSMIMFQPLIFRGVSPSKGEDITWGKNKKTTWGGYYLWGEALLKIVFLLTKVGYVIVPWRVRFTQESWPGIVTSFKLQMLSKIILPDITTDVWQFMLLPALTNCMWTTKKNMVAWLIYRRGVISFYLALFFDVSLVSQTLKSMVYLPTFTIEIAKCRYLNTLRIWIWGLHILPHEFYSREISNGATVGPKFFSP